MTQIKTYNTYSRKKSFKTLSRSVFVTALPKPFAPPQESDVELDDGYSSGPNEVNQEFPAASKNENDSSVCSSKRCFTLNEDVEEVCETRESDRSGAGVLEMYQGKDLKESPTKKRNAGKRVLKMKSNTTAREDDISDKIFKVSLKDSEQKAVKPAFQNRNPVNHTVSKVSNTYASIARSYVEANEA